MLLKRISSLAVFLAALMLFSFSSDALIRTPTSEGAHLFKGYCTDIQEGTPKSLHFCAVDVEIEGRGTQVSHVLYVEIYDSKRTEIDENTITVVHAEKRHELKYIVDGTATASAQDSEGNEGRMTLYFVLLPEILVRILSDGQPIEVYVSINGEKHWLKPTLEEMKEIRMVANVSTLTERGESD